MSPTDRGALEQALKACRAESPARAKQLDAMLSDRPWEEVAQFASYCAQIHALQLMPWQSPPCYPTMSALNEPYGDPGANREGAELALRMRRLKVSRWHPDPARECDRVEAEQRQAAK